MTDQKREQNLQSLEVLIAATRVVLARCQSGYRPTEAQLNRLDDVLLNFEMQVCGQTRMLDDGE